MSQIKVAVVTGSNKGIGFAIVKALGQNFKGDVILTARSENRGKEALEALNQKGIKVKFHQLDIDSELSIKKLHDYMLEQYGGIDILVNNAGIAFKNADTTPFGTQAMITLKTNFFGTLNVCKILLPIVRPGARVVNVSSFASQRSLEKCSPDLQREFRSDQITEEQLIKRMKEFIKFANEGTHEKHGYPNTAYGVSKLGVTVMSKIYAKLLRESGRNDILLNACCPGWVRTDMAGDKASKSPEEGAETPVYLALLPEGATEPHGEFISDKTVQKW